MSEVVVRGSFDNLRSGHLRLLQDAARRGPVHLLLASDRATEVATGRRPAFPAEERAYLLEAIRFVDRVTVVPDWSDESGLPGQSTPSFPDPIGPVVETGRPRVIVTGCYDWFHSGHVRFFEEAAGYGDLYVAIGSDANVRLLKGEGHPLFPEDERRYMVACVRHVHAALVSTGTGWMDAAPEIERIRPDLYVVNEDGDRPEKRDFCRTRGIEYVVLTRTPREGLPRRQSTDLRGF